MLKNYSHKIVDLNEVYVLWCRMTMFYTVSYFWS